jgi:Transposase IS116/IS110/IS902 family
MIFLRLGRCRSDAAFAALSGTSPLQATSGKTVRHRLNRGGDRALNCAIHTIAITRIQRCPTIKNYVARRTAEGKSSREIQRCLKRSIARELYRALNTSTTAHRPDIGCSSGRLTNIEASEGVMDFDLRSMRWVMRMGGVVRRTSTQGDLQSTTAVPIPAASHCQRSAGPSVADATRQGSSRGRPLGTRRRSFGGRKRTAGRSTSA